MKTTSAVLAALAATLVIGTLHAQVAERPIPRLVQKDGRFALFVDDAPFLILGVEDQDLGLESTWPSHPKRLGCHGIPACQHDRNTDLLGSD